MSSTSDSTLMRAVCSGSAAGLASAAVAAAGAAKAGHRPYAVMNAVTHCLWPDAAPREEALSAKYTGTGAGIHLGSAVFWGVLFETLCGRRPSPAKVAICAATTSAVAYVVDYHVVPKRLTPGYEAHLSNQGLGLTYVALGAGFALAGLLRGASH
ncbi:conserved membrane hypothetical protein [Burkholderia sp. 8Y]|uniref:hypothetical protein n=1 Tax=Burkholderia sp. 8Y TaxID=2653133 RepID=UPI0012EF6FC6|nr:hypothetical protein [Burkholderia sp. 8Y]VXB40621.1 conserved membrane hypothetical protein [Burkholderia sp. 8Y]